MRFPPSSKLLCTDNVSGLISCLLDSAAAITSGYVGFSAVIGCRQKLL